VKKYVTVIAAIAVLSALAIAQVPAGQSVWVRPGYNAGNVTVNATINSANSTAAVTFTDSTGSSNPAKGTATTGGEGVDSCEEATTFALGGPNGGTYRIKAGGKVQEKVNGTWRTLKPFVAPKKETPEKEGPAPKP
jgi:hypothetical protein